MKTTRRPDRAELDFYIFEYGRYRAAEMFNLSEIQIENILFGNFRQNKDSVKIEIDNSIKPPPQSKYLTQGINENYSRISRFYVRSKHAIDRYSAMTDDDRLHEHLINVILTCHRFKYKSEYQAYNYIIKRITLERKAVQQTIKRLQKKIKIQSVESIEIPLDLLDALETKRANAKLLFNLKIGSKKHADN